MSWLDQFLWQVFPYIMLTMFVFGCIYRYNTDQYGWKAASTEMLEKNILMWGSYFFHYGIIFAFFGHVMGVLVPYYVHRAFGLPDEFYHWFAFAGGAPVGLVAIVGITILAYRKLVSKRVWMNTTHWDLFIFALLFVVMVTGMFNTVWNFLFAHDFDYRFNLSIWARSVLLLHPDASLMSDVPNSFKTHIILSLTLIGLWPFTKLVHVFSLPLAYLFRSYIVYRRPYYGKR